MSHRFNLLRTLLAVTAAGTLVFACGKRGNDLPAGSLDGQVPQQKTKSLAEAQKISAEAHVSCSLDSDCPEPVGMVIAARQTGLDYCTGFLVGDDVAVTSAHCVPEELRSDGAACVDRIRMVFPTSKRIAESQAGCVSVLRVVKSAAGPGDRDFNYAFIKLDRKPIRGHFPISTSGMSEGMSMLVSKVKITSTEAAIGDIQTESCRVVQNSAILPDFTHALSPIATVADCSVELAGFGAPVYSEGKVHAIANYVFDGRDQLQTRYNGQLRDKHLSSFLFTTNLACATNPLDPGFELPDSCNPAAVSSGSIATIESLKTPALFQRLRSEMNQRFKDWSEKNSDRIRWKQSGMRDDFAGTFSPTPDCLNATDKWLDQYKKPWWQFGGYHANAELKFQRIFMTVRFEMNADLQTIGTVVSTTEAAPITLRFSPKDIAKSGTTRVTMPGLGSNVVIGKCK